MLKRIRIQGFKSIEDLEIRLPEFMVLLGPNAVGKSNFLDALHLFSRLATARKLDEAFGHPHRGAPLEAFALGDGGVRELLRRPEATMRFEADLELCPSAVESVESEISEHRAVGTNGGAAPISNRALRYTLGVAIAPKSGVLTVADERLEYLTSTGRPCLKPEPRIVTLPDQVSLRQEHKGHPRRYDRRLSYTVLSVDQHVPHNPHVTAVKRELESWQFYYLEPRERMRQPSPIREAWSIGPMGEHLAAFLNTVKTQDPKQFAGIERALTSVIPTVTGIEVEPNDLGQVEVRFREGDRLMPASVVSEGTLRVLGLLAIRATRAQPGLVGFEEPENGVHPRRVQYIARIVESSIPEQTQTIVTTHSPVLADRVRRDSLYVCLRRQDRTVIEPLTSWGEFGRSSAIKDALDDEPLPSERILRGDLDA